MPQKLMHTPVFAFDESFTRARYSCAYSNVGIFESADAWNSKVTVSGKLVTGQNPQSSEACAEAVLGLLK